MTRTLPLSPHEQITSAVTQLRISGRGPLIARQLAEFLAGDFSSADARNKAAVFCLIHYFEHRLSGTVLDALREGGAAPMKSIRLYTREGLFVQEVFTPPFLIDPDVIMWGVRPFAKRHTGPCAGCYCEVYCSAAFDAETLKAVGIPVPAEGGAS